MKKRVSMADIGRRLGVSQATVSYVLNDPNTDLVGATMRERVIATAHEMGYQPNRAAQSLKGRPSYVIELFAFGYYPAFYARSLYEFALQLAPTPYQLYIIQPADWTKSDWEKIDSGWPTDGVILCDVRPPDTAIAQLKERHKPVVAIGLDPVSNVDHVRIDVYPALLRAMQHLVARGGRVAYVSQYREDDPGKETDPRYVVYCSVMGGANREQEVIVTPELRGKETRIKAREVVCDYIRKHGCPDAMFCHNDERAIATLAALRDMNYRVPQDTLVIGHDGIEDTAYQSPTLSTIEYPIEEAAHIAWQFLQRRIEQPDIPLQSATLTARLQLRESSVY